MATITTDLICNLNQPVEATFLHGNLFSQDNAGNTINVYVLDNGAPATIGGTVSANVIRADGNTVAVSGAIDGNKAYVILPQACYAVPGRVEIIIKLTQNTTITTIAAIVANVYRSTTDTVVDPGTIIPSISSLIAQIEAAVDSIPVDYSGLLATIAADYSSSKTYPVVGMYAWQGGVLKRNIVPITTAETYTAAHWTNAVLGDDLSALKSAFDDVSSATRNLWIWGDYTFTGQKKVTENANIPAGTYTMSALVNRAYPSNCRMVFYKNSVSSSNMLANPYIAANSRESVTFTLAEKADVILLYSGANSTSTVETEWLNIQIESGTSATEYINPTTAVDFVERETGAKTKTRLEAVSSDSSDTQKYTLKDKTGTKKVTSLFEFENGVTYTISAKVTSSDSGTNSLIKITNAAATKAVASGTIAHDGTRQSFTFTANGESQRFYIYAASTDSASEEETVTATDIEIAVGSSAAPYFPDGWTAVDYVAREKVASLEDSVSEITSGRMLIAEQEITGPDSIGIDLPEMDFALGLPVFFADAMFTRESGVTDYPRARIGVKNGRQLERYSTYYKIGAENAYEAHEWRCPAFVWGKKSARIIITVPSGCVLTIRKMGYRLDNSIDRHTTGARFFARPGDCNMTPELTIPCMQMASRAGYDTFVIIPKISSDGVWFAYHDDTWDISTTQYRNTDGSVITDDEYNGDRFDQIPFDYLLQFSAGYQFGPVFYDIKTMRLEEGLAFLSKTGMKLRFSMHPSAGINTSAKLAELKRLVAKYGLLKDLTIIVNDFDSLYAAFGNDIGGYCFPNSTGASWSEGATNRPDAALTKAQTAAINHPDITVPISCGLWVDSLFSDKTKAEALVKDVLDAGYAAEAFSYYHVGIDGGESRLQLWSEDYRWLMSIGVTGFTDGYNSSIGLNW